MVPIILYFKISVTFLGKVLIFFFLIYKTFGYGLIFFS
jgi:hypothetical protein